MLQPVCQPATACHVVSAMHATACLPACYCLSCHECQLLLLLHVIMSGTGSAALRLQPASLLLRVQQDPGVLLPACYCYCQLGGNQACVLSATATDRTACLPAPATAILIVLPSMSATAAAIDFCLPLLLPLLLPLFTMPYTACPCYCR